MKEYKTIIFIVLLLAIGAGISKALLVLTEKPRTPKSAADAYPARIVCFNPAAAEAIFAIGCADKLVGVSNFCTYPPQAARISRVGGTINPNFERIRVLNPDLVIIQGKNEKIVNFCDSKGIKTIRIDMTDIHSVLTDIRTLGKKLGSTQQSAELCEKIKNELQLVKDRIAGQKKTKVFFSLFRTPGSLSKISTIGANTHVDELIKIAGGQNIFGGLEIPYPEISKEALLRLQPEIIIEPKAAASFSRHQRKRCLSQWQALSNIPAVRNNRIYFPDADLILKPGPRVAKAADELAKIIHPEPQQ